MQVDVLNNSGQAGGTVELPDQLFASDISDYALYRAVVTYEGNQRQGNASTQTRSEVSRTTKKHHRQKGTGMARRGSLRSPVVRGGGVAFGPKPRSYYTKLPRQLKRLAFSSALSLKAAEGQVKVIDDLEFEKPSTKAFAQVLAACGLEGAKVLFITAESQPVLIKSCRNIPGVEIEPAATASTYDIVAAESVLLSKGALDKLVQRFDGGANDGSEEQSE